MAADRADLRRCFATLVDARTGSTLLRTPIDIDRTDARQVAFAPDCRTFALYSRKRRELSVYALRGDVPPGPAVADLPPNPVQAPPPLPPVVRLPDRPPRAAPPRPERAVDLRQKWAAPAGLGRAAAIVYDDHSKSVVLRSTTGPAVVAVDARTGRPTPERVEGFAPARRRTSFPCPSGGSVTIT